MTKDIRRSITLIESQNTEQNVSEAAPMGFLKSLSTTFGSLFSDVKLGELEVGSASNKIFKDYVKYLGRIGHKPGTEDVGDMYSFLVSAGVPEKIIFQAISRGFSTSQTPVRITTQNELVNWWNTDIKTDYKNKIGKVFLNVTQEAARLPDQAVAPAAMQTRGQRGAQASQNLGNRAANAANAGNAGNTTTLAGNGRFSTAASQQMKQALSGSNNAAKLAAINNAINALSAIPESALNELDIKGAFNKAKSWIKGKTQPSSNTSQQPPVNFNTGDTDFDNFLNQALATHGKDAVLQVLKNYKAKLVTKTDPFDAYKSEIRKLAGIQNTKALPQNMADGLKVDLAKLAKGDKDSGAYAADKIMKYAQAGYDVKGLVSSWLNNAKAGERFLNIKEWEEITGILAEYNLTFTDLGIGTRLYETSSDYVAVFMLESASGGSTSAGAIASVPNAMGDISKRMPTTPNLFGYVEEETRKSKKASKLKG